MGLLDWLLASKPRSPTALQARREWLRKRAPESGTQLAALRWVAVDTETSGLDPRRDRLISIGACAGRGAAICPGDSFQALLRQDVVSPAANVLVHGIGHAAQAAGGDREQVLMSYLRYAGADPIVGYHTLFDRTILMRAAREALGIAYRPPALDVALLLPALSGQPERSRWELDRWLEQLGLRAYARHDALADAYATAQLFLVVQARAHAVGRTTLADLLDVQRTFLQRQVLEQA